MINVNETDHSSCVIFITLLSEIEQESLLEVIILYFLLFAYFCEISKIGVDLL